MLFIAMILAIGYIFGIIKNFKYSMNYLDVCKWVYPLSLFIEATCIGELTVNKSKK